MVSPSADVVRVRMFSPFLRMACVLVAIVLVPVSLLAAPPSSDVDAKIVGQWRVSAPGLERVYEITTGRNVKIIGGTAKDKFCHLQPADDGSYRMTVDIKSLEKIVYNPSSDELQVEFYKTKRDFDLGIVQWKSAGTRVSQK